MRPCVVCDNARDNQLWSAREMMFGSRDRFEYLECAACGCLAITTPPDDLARYYPPDYYAHGRPRRESPLRRALWRILDAHRMGKPSALGWLLARRFAAPDHIGWLRTAGVPRDATILDIGCGDGRLLRRLRAGGWHHLTGMDPFLEADVEWPDGVALRKRTLDAMLGQYDFVMAHHSFEHMPDPRAALGHIARLLAPGGRVLIRVPVADSEAWRTYRADWVQLDPPRHLFIPTVAGMARLAADAALQVDRVTYDSTAFQFWGSEQYRRDIPLADALSRRADGCLCAPDERARYDARARALNATGGADQACFYLRAAR